MGEAMAAGVIARNGGVAIEGWGRRRGRRLGFWGVWLEMGAELLLKEAADGEADETDVGEAEAGGAEADLGIDLVGEANSGFGMSWSWHSGIVGGGCG
jgi:hypothetical protein